MASHRFTDFLNLISRNLAVLDNVLLLEYSLSCLMRIIACYHCLPNSQSILEETSYRVVSQMTEILKDGEVGDSVKKLIVDRLPHFMTSKILYKYVISKEF